MNLLRTFVQKLLTREFQFVKLLSIENYMNVFTKIFNAYNLAVTKSLFSLFFYFMVSLLFSSSIPSSLFLFFPSFLLFYFLPFFLSGNLFFLLHYLGLSLQTIKLLNVKCSWYMPRTLSLSTLSPWVILPYVTHHIEVKIMSAVD